MINYRLDIAKKYLDDAVDLFDRSRFNSSASRAYYSSYQAMCARIRQPQRCKNMGTSGHYKTFCKGLLDKPRLS